MRSCLLGTLAGFFILLPSCYASGPTKLVPQLPGLILWDTQGGGGMAGSAPGMVRRRFAVEFKNETLNEIAEIDIHLRVEVGGRTVFTSKPVAIREFDNMSYPHSGSLLPGSKSFWSHELDFEHPSQYWRTDTRDYLEIVGVHLYTAGQDLHDAGHLLTWLGGHSSQDAIAMYKAHPELLHVHNSRNLTAFMMEFAVGDIPTIKYMAAHGCSWNDKSTGGSTIVHLACLHDGTHLELALQHVRDIEVKTKSGRTPLMTAITFGNPITVEWLLKHKANPNALDAGKQPVAIYAITNGQNTFIEQLVTAGANPKYIDSRGFGWMHYAAGFSVAMMDLVHRLGVPVDERTGNGLTPLMMCAWNGKYSAATWLLQHGANPDLKDKEGRDCYALSKLSNTLHSDRFFRQAMIAAGRKPR